jgi:hypothetical protein
VYFRAAPKQLLKFSRLAIAKSNASLFFCLCEARPDYWLPNESSRKLRANSAGSEIGG